MKEKWDNAEDILYPNRPKKPLPPSGEQSELVGTYYNKGYGKLHVREVEKSGQKTLVAEPENTTWRFNMVLKHISADFYIAYLDLPGNSSILFKEALKAEFKYDIGGKPLSLDIEYAVESSDMYEGIQSYERVEDSKKIV